MKVLVLEQNDDFREDLLVRIEEAVKLSLVRGVSIVGRSLLQAGSENPDLIFLSFLDEVDYSDVVSRVQAMFPEASIVLVVPSEQYVEEAVELRRKTNLRVVAAGDMPQIAQLVLDFDSSKGSMFGGMSGKLVSVVHVSGGVGASTVALSLSQLFSRSNLSTLLLDLDYVRQTLSEWASYGILERREYANIVDSSSPVTFEKLRSIIQQVPADAPSFGFVGLFDSFVKSISFLGSGVGYGAEGLDRLESLLIEMLRAYDTIVADLGSNWGLGSFATLSLSSKVFIVMPEDRVRLKSDLRFLQKIASESDDPLEFDFQKWRPVIVAKSQKAPSASIKEIVDESGLFQDGVSIITLPYQRSAVNWLEPGSDGLSQVDKTYEADLLNLGKIVCPGQFIE